VRARKSMLTDLGAGQALPPLISVTIRDAVILTGICRSKLYELIQQGRLPIGKIGRSTLVPYDALCNLIGQSTEVTDQARTIDRAARNSTSSYSKRMSKTHSCDPIVQTGKKSRSQSNVPTLVACRRQEDFFDILSGSKA
jgi:excisionase family DNA binding protein